MQDAQQQATQAEQAKVALEQQVHELQEQLEAQQQRMTVLKGQLIAGQAQAEECEQAVVQDAVDKVEAEYRQRLSAAESEVRARAGSRTSLQCCSSVLECPAIARASPR